MTGRYVPYPPSFFGRGMLTYGVVEQMFARGWCALDSPAAGDDERRALCAVGMAPAAGVIESVSARRSLCAQGCAVASDARRVMLCALCGCAAGVTLCAVRVWLASLGTLRNRAKTYGV